MSMRINNNVAAFNAYRNLSVTSDQMSKSLERLSSGFRINRAADDASGLVTSEALRSQVGGLKVAVRNAQDGTSVVQTAEGALSEVTTILQRMRDLALHAGGNGAADSTSIAADQAEFSSLNAELDNIAANTTFGGAKLLDGSYSKGFALTSDLSSNVTVTIDNGTATKGFSSTDLSLNAINLSTAAGATELTAIDAAIAKVSGARGTLGGVQNQFEHAINNLQVTQENLTASESRIRDTDMASEMTQYSKTQILVQAGTAMLAQANSAPQQVLQLLRG